MKTVHIFKAQPLTDRHTCNSDTRTAGLCLACQPESVTIVIDRTTPKLPDKPTPPFKNVLDEARAIYQKEATTLADTLMSALPGGVIDQLLAELMLRKASLFAVPHTFPPPLVEHDPVTKPLGVLSVEQGEASIDPAPHITALYGGNRGTGGHLAFTEDQHFIVEAALNHGFTVVDDDVTVMQCKVSQLVALVEGYKKMFGAQPQDAHTFPAPICPECGGADVPPIGFEDDRQCKACGRIF